MTMTRFVSLLCLLTLGDLGGCRRQRMNAKLEQSVRDYQSQVPSASSKDITTPDVTSGLVPERLKKMLPEWTKQANFPDWMSLALIVIPVFITLFLLALVCMLAVSMKAAVTPEGQEPEVVPPVSKLLGRIMAIAIPTAIGNTLFMFAQVVNMIILGHVGTTDQIAAVGLGNTMQNCFGLIIGMGLITGLDPICSAATGSGNYPLAAAYLQRCRCVTTLQLVWMLPLLFCTYPLLVLIGQDPDVAWSAGLYNQASSVGLFFFFNMFSVMSWLRAKAENGVPVLLWACVICIHVPSAFLWVAVLDLGNFGCGLANTISFILGFIAVHWYAVKVAKKNGLPVSSILWIQADGLKDWGSFLKVSVPAMLQSCTEMWYFEIVTFVTGYLGKLDLASWVSAYTVYTLLQMPSLGISTGSSVVVGFALGEQKPQMAKALIITSVAMVYILGLILSIALIFLRYPVCWVFNDIPAIHVIMANILILMAITAISDYGQTTAAGILRGLFRPGWTVVGFILAFWIISMPLGLTLGFPLGVGVYGLGFANLIGSSIAAVFFGICLMVVDIDGIAVEIKERNAENDKKASVEGAITQLPRYSTLSGLNGGANVVVTM